VVRLADPRHYSLEFTGVTSPGGLPAGRSGRLRSGVEATGRLRARSDRVDRAAQHAKPEGPLALARTKNAFPVASAISCARLLVRRIAPWYRGLLRCLANRARFPTGAGRRGGRYAHRLARDLDVLDPVEVPMDEGGLTMDQGPRRRLSHGDFRIKANLVEERMRVRAVDSPCASAG
jgi:hypothetical protein